MLSRRSFRAEGEQTRWVLPLTAAAQFVLQLDFSIVNVALPQVQHALSFSDAGLQWVVAGYALTYGALLLVGGRVADLIGHRRALLTGLVLFAASSSCGGLAWSAAALVVSRLVQGASAALVAPAALGMLTVAYERPDARARALGIFQGSTAAGATAGILLGGVLTQVFGWRSVLLVNPPVIGVLLLFMLRALPRPPRHGARKESLDPGGTFCFTLATGLFIYGLTQSQSTGFVSTPVLGVFIISGLLFAGFVVVERRVAEPVLPTWLLRDRARRIALIVMVLSGAVVAGYVYFVSLYLQHELGLTAAATGAALAPATLTVLAVSTFATRRLLGLFGVGRVLPAALALIAVGQLWLAQVSAHSSYVTAVLPGILLTAAGMGVAFPACSVVITANVAPDSRGVAGSMFVTAMQVGSAAGLGTLAALAAARTGSTGSRTEGYALSFAVSAAVAVVAAVLVAVGYPRTSPRTGPPDSGRRNGTAAGDRITEPPSAPS